MMIQALNISANTIHYVIIRLYNYDCTDLVADVQRLPVEKVSFKNLDTGSAGVLEVKLVVFTNLLPFLLCPVLVPLVSRNQGQVLWSVMRSI